MLKSLGTALRFQLRPRPGKVALGLILGCVSFLGILSCSEPVGETQSHGGPIADHVSFVDTLRRKGYAVEIVGEIEQPFLRVKGTRLRLRGANLEQPAELQSYDYENAQTAKADADRIGPDGNPKGTQIDWIAPPHFYLRGRVLVIYIGSEPRVVALLTDLLSPQFAGQ